MPSLALSVFERTPEPRAASGLGGIGYCKARTLPPERSGSAGKWRITEWQTLFLNESRVPAKYFKWEGPVASRSGRDVPKKWKTWYFARRSGEYDWDGRRWAADPLTTGFSHSPEEIDSRPGQFAVTLYRGTTGCRRA